MTKEEYIWLHPKSYLAKNLLCNTWPDDAKISIISGLQAPFEPRSNLYRALKVSVHNMYCVGGHLKRGTEGFWFAVY